MSTAVEDGAIQRVAGGEEQGGDQGVWQVLSGGGYYCIAMHEILYTLERVVLSLWQTSEQTRVDTAQVTPPDSHRLGDRQSRLQAGANLVLRPNLKVVQVTAPAFPDTANFVCSPLQGPPNGPTTVQKVQKGRQGERPGSAPRWPLRGPC